MFLRECRKVVALSLIFLQVAAAAVSAHPVQRSPCPSSIHLGNDKSSDIGGDTGFFVEGGSLHEYLRSNPVNHRDPSGLSSVPELAATQGMSTHMRVAMFGALGMFAAGTTGGIRAGYQAHAEGKSNAEIMQAALGGFNSTLTRFEVTARVWLGSAVLAAGGPAGLALLGAMGVLEAGDSYTASRQRQEMATSQAELDLATFDSVFSVIGIGGGMSAGTFGGAAWLRGSSLHAQATASAPPRLPRGRAGEWSGHYRGASFRADVVRNGQELQLNNVFLKGEIGVGGFKSFVEAVKNLARQEGLDRVRVFAVRGTGGNKGGVDRPSLRSAVDSPSMSPEHARSLLSFLADHHASSLAPALGRRKKVPLHFRYALETDDEGCPARLETEYERIGWRGVCDLVGLTTIHEQNVGEFPWNELPHAVGPAATVGQAALYHSRNDVMGFPIAAQGLWSNLRCPGWFGLALYNGLLRVGFAHRAGQ